MRGIVLATVRQTFLFSPYFSTFFSFQPPSRRHIAVQRRCTVKNSGSPAECRRKFSFSIAFEGGECRGEERRGWNQRVERFSAEAAGWLLSDVVSFTIYSPRASPLVKVNNYADASGGRALLFVFFCFFFFWKKSWKFFFLFFYYNNTFVVILMDMEVDNCCNIISSNFEFEGVFIANLIFDRSRISKLIEL